MSQQRLRTRTEEMVIGFNLARPPAICILRWRIRSDFDKTEMVFWGKVSSNGCKQGKHGHVPQRHRDKHGPCAKGI